MEGGGGGGGGKGSVVKMKLKKREGVADGRRERTVRDGGEFSTVHSLRDLPKAVEVTY